MIKNAFVKCGISVPIEGSKDKDIDIRSVPNYVVRKDYKVEQNDEEDLF